MVSARAESDLVRRRERTGATASPGTDARRVLQLILAATWLLDGMLQSQSFMYTKAFGQMIGDTAAGNPGVIARPIMWNAALVEHHLVLLNTVFATAAAPGMPMSGTGGMSGMAGGSTGGMPALHAPTLALIFALLLVAFTVHDVDRPAGVDGYFRVMGRRYAGSAVAAAAATESPAERLLHSPAVMKGCQVTMGVTMAFMLIIMI
jgi:hypothetical protein